MLDDLGLAADLVLDRLQELAQRRALAGADVEDVRAVGQADQRVAQARATSPT